jgi:molybdate transport system permease protein
MRCWGRPLAGSGGGEGLAPPLIALVAVAAAVFYALPLVGLALRAPWSEAGRRLADPEFLEALRLSLLVSLSAVVVSLIFGTPLAWVLARGNFPGRRLLRGIVVLPMVLPPVVAGVGLLTALGRRGIVGPILLRAGISLPFSTPAAIIAAAFVSSPFAIVTLEAAFRSVNLRLEGAAASLGASRLMILRTITLPAVRPSLAAGATLCWARALGEFGATIIFAGNIAGLTQTGPLAIYQQLQKGDFGGAILLSLVLFAVSLAVLVSLRTRVAMQ